MNETIKNLIGWWKLKGQRETDPFVKFFFFWVCFDAWVTAKSGKDNDREKIAWFEHNKNQLKDAWGDILSSKTISWLNELRTLSPIEDMRPGHGGEKTCLVDVGNPTEVIKFIYQIRCNLFHGSKSPMDRRDLNLVELSARILEKWVVWSLRRY